MRPLRHARHGSATRAAWLLLAFAACAQSEGIRPTPDGSGPRVVFDPDRRPFPEIPFPNDVATRLDPDSPTGRRLNVGETGETRMEREVRRRLNGLDGFGTFQPITVSFDAPLELGDVIARHQGNLDPADDAVYVVCIDPDSPDYGEPVPLDMGRGNFPAILRPDTVYHPADPRQGGEALLFETADEDRDGDGVLDPGEDTDDDGVLDRPNVWPDGATPADGLLTFYERQTDTLILRPMVPLRERSEYAVVLTSRLKGLDGQPVRSPHPYVNHASQTGRLVRLDDILAAWRASGRADLGLDDIAFTWAFTTQTVTADLVAIREGLYGFGPLAWLAGQVPPDATPLPAMNADQPEPRNVLPGELVRLLAAAALVPAFGITQSQANGLDEDLAHVAYLVQGAFDSPDFLGSDPAEFPWDKTFDLDLRTGRARVAPERLWFMMTVPRTTDVCKPPFPVAIYGHGFGQARVEFLGFAGILARHCIAGVGIDAWGHGVYIRPDDRQLMLDLADGLGFKPFVETFLLGRGRDLDGDGKIDAGGDTFSAYPFHTRDTLRQSLVDHLQLVRVLRGFDGVRRWAADADGDGRDDLAGDFDGDGVVDVGGEQPYYLWGSSMGGIHSSVLGAVEPAIRAVAPISGGAGLTNLVARSQQISVRADTVMRALGPIVVGQSDPERPGITRVTLVAALAKKIREMPIGEIGGLAPGDRVRVTVGDGLRERVSTVRADGTFTVHVRTDREDRLAIAFEAADGTPRAVMDTWAQDAFFDRGPDTPRYRAGEPLRSPVEGWGMTRGSPDLRRLIGLAQLVLEPADPINWARHFVAEPLPIRPDGPRATDLLVLVTLGDNMDPVDIHAAYARAAGILDFTTPDPRYGTNPNDWLISRWVLEGWCGYGRHPPNARGEEVIFDPDALDRLVADDGLDGNGFLAPKPPPGEELRWTVTTATGQSGIRFAHMLPCGKHSFFITDPANPFNVDEYLAALAASWFRSEGRTIRDDGCLADSSCPLR